MRRREATVCAGVLALAAGCQAFGGTVGVTVDGRHRAGVSAELRYGPMTMLGEHHAVQYIVAPSIGYDGELIAGLTYSLAFVRLPDSDPDDDGEDDDGDGAAYRLGVGGGSTELARQGPDDGSSQLGLHAAYLPRVDVDAYGKGWSNLGIAVDAAARWSFVEGPEGMTQALGGDEPDDWWLRVGVIADIAERMP
jgi:hypothetical protein